MSGAARAAAGALAREPDSLGRSLTHCAGRADAISPFFFGGRSLLLPFWSENDFEREAA